MSAITSTGTAGTEASLVRAADNNSATGVTLLKKAVDDDKSLVNTLLSSLPDAGGKLNVSA